MANKKKKPEIAENKPSADKITDSDFIMNAESDMIADDEPETEEQEQEPETEEQEQEPETEEQEQEPDQISQLKEEIAQLRKVLSDEFMKHKAKPQVADEVEAFVMRDGGYTQRALAKNK